MSKISASVIIPTHNRMSSLRGALDSLARQTCPPDSFEVIVVDDGSTDDTAAVCARGWYFPLHYFSQPNTGAAVARNRGAELAHGETLIFLDDDIAVVPQFVSAMVSCVNSRTIAVGTLYPGVPSGASTFERIRAKEFVAPAAGDEEIPFTGCLSGILAARRAAFFDIGGFGEVAGDGRVVWGDVEFGYRGRLLGYCFRRCGDAIARHYDAAAGHLHTCVTRSEQAACAAARLFSMHPDIVYCVPMFRDKRPIDWVHDPTGLVARKMCRAVTATRPVLSGMEQVVRVLERVAPQPALLRPLYRWVISSYIYRGYRRGLAECAPEENL